MCLYLPGKELADNPGRAKEGMRVQLLAHIVIIVFILLGNVGLFVSYRRKLKEGR